MWGLIVAKVVGGVVLFLILAVVGAGLYLLENLDGLVKQAIEQVGSDVMGTEIRVREVKVDLQEGSAALSGLTVANPVGFSDGNLFTMEAINVAIDVASLTSTVYVINEISVMGAQVLVEQRGTQTNVQSLLDGMPESEAFDGAAASDSADVELAIKRIKFADGSLELRSDTLGNHDLSLPGFNLKRIGSATDGKTPDEVGAEIALQLTSLVASTVSDAIADIAGQRAKTKLREKLGKTAIEGINKLKGLFRKDD